MNQLEEKYLKEVRGQLKEEFNLTNILAVPRLVKIVVNIGVGDAKDNAAILDKVRTNIEAITGQKSVVTKAKKSISAFKLIQGAPIGVMVTLRGDKMYAFLDKLINIVLPKLRDFRGVPDQSLDNQGNFNLGLREQIVFPEVDYKNIDKGRGLQITINTTAQQKEQGKRLLELLGMPFRKGESGR